MSLTDEDKKFIEFITDYDASGMVIDESKEYISKLRTELKAKDEQIAGLEQKVQQLKDELEDEKADNSLQEEFIKNVMEGNKDLEQEVQRLKEVLDEVLGLATDAPELNINNYDDVEADRLNGCMILIHQKLTEANNE